MGQGFYETQVMICVICTQAQTIDELTPVAFVRGEFRLLVRSVPARVCPSCGEAYVDEAVAHQLLQIAGQASDMGILDMQCEYSAFQV